MKQIHDVTLSIKNNLPVWPDDPAVNLFRISKMEEGQPVNVSKLEFCVHSGTYVDAPYHFIMNGSTVETMPLNVLIGPVQVLEIPDQIDEIDRKVLLEAGLSAGVERILFKTRNSNYWLSDDLEFQTNFVGITGDAAQLLVETGIKLVGIDYLSISPFSNSIPTHQILLQNQVIILEGVNLQGIRPGEYTLYCLPLKLAGSDGAPARVVLVEE